MLDKAPWELYAKAMFNLFGFPLWHADPEITENFGPREVELGSVGFLDRGEFRHLFNARKGKDDPFNAGRVPSTFEQFNPPNLSITAPKPILRQPYVTSDSVRELTVSLEGDAESPGVANLVSAGGSISFECKRNAGALLVLDQPAMGQSIPTKRHIVTYLHAHMDSWFEWANNGLGCDVRIHDIKFVSGTIKTTRWACAAFSGSYRNKRGLLKVNAAGVGDLGINVSIESQVFPSWFYNNGPSMPTGATLRPSSSSDHFLTAVEDGRRASSSTPLSSRCDQCIFFHYFAVKKRTFSWLPRKIEASADPLELPSDDDSDTEGNSPVLAAAGSATEYDIGDHPSSDVTDDGQFDPVAVLLDYMLRKTEAKYAVASDRDVLAIFGVDGVPDDIMAGLAAINPPIEVDENDVATVIVDMTWLDEQTSAQAAVPSKEVSGSPTGAGHVEDTPDAVGEVQTQQPDVDPSANTHMGSVTQDDDNIDNIDDDTTGQQNPDPQNPTHDGSVMALAYSPNGRYAASGSEDTTVIVWNVPEERTMHKFTSHSDTVSSLAFSPDNQLLASGSNDQHVILWTVATGQEFKRLDPQVSIHSVAFSPDGTKLIAGAYDGSLCVWDTATYAAPLKISKHLAVVTFIVFSPDGRLMATGGTESTCYVWETATLANMEPKSVLQGHKGMVCCAAFSPDGERIVTASDDGSSRVWKCENGDALVLLHEHGGPVWSVAFSPDGKRVASGSSDSTVKVCDSYSGDRLLSLEGHESMVNVVRFSSDGIYIASAASDSTVRLWNAEDGSLVAIYNEHSDNVTTVQFSPNGSTLASGSHDGTVRIRPIVAVLT